MSVLSPDSTRIGTLREQHLHAALKEWYRDPGDLTEVDVEGFVVDIVRGGELVSAGDIVREPDLVGDRDLAGDRDVVGKLDLVEIQTRGFSSMRRKLDCLLDRHAVRLVHPIAAEKWIRRIDDNGAQVSRRKSPKRGIAADVCAELVSFPTLLSHPHLTLEVVMVQEEEVRRPDPAAWRRNGWGIAERRLLAVLERRELTGPADLMELIPDDLPDTFTTADLAAGLGRSRHLAQEVAYCLREAGVLLATGRTRAGIQYQRL